MNGICKAGTIDLRMDDMWMELKCWAHPFTHHCSCTCMYVHPNSRMTAHSLHCLAHIECTQADKWTRSQPCLRLTECRGAEQEAGRCRGAALSAPGAHARAWARVCVWCTWACLLMCQGQRPSMYPWSLAGLVVMFWPPKGRVVAAQHGGMLIWAALFGQEWCVARLTDSEVMRFCNVLLTPLLDLCTEEGHRPAERRHVCTEEGHRSAERRQVCTEEGHRPSERRHFVHWGV